MEINAYYYTLTYSQYDTMITVIYVCSDFIAQIIGKLAVNVSLKNLRMYNSINVLILMIIPNKVFLNNQYLYNQ